MYPKPGKFLPALYGAIIIAVISSIPYLSMVNCLCCAGVMLGAFLGVYFYKKDFQPDTPPLNTGDCLQIGVLSGALGGSFYCIVVGLVFWFKYKFDTNIFLEELQKPEYNIPPDAMDKIEDFLMEWPFMVLGILFFFATEIIFTLFGLLGGLIGYSAFKSKYQVMPTQTMPMPPQYQQPQQPQAPLPPPPVQQPPSEQPPASQDDEPKQDPPTS